MGNALLIVGGLMFMALGNFILGLLCFIIAWCNGWGLPTQVKK